MSEEPKPTPAGAVAALRPHLGTLYALLPPVDDERRGEQRKWDDATHAPALRALLNASEILGRAVDDLTAAVAAQGRREKEMRDQLAGRGDATVGEAVRDAHLRRM